MSATIEINDPSENTENLGKLHCATCAAVIFALTHELSVHEQQYYVKLFGTSKVKNLSQYTGSKVWDTEEAASHLDRFAVNHQQEKGKKEHKMTGVVYQKLPEKEENF